MTRRTVSYRQLGHNEHSSPQFLAQQQSASEDTEGNCPLPPRPCSYQRSSPACTRCSYDSDSCRRHEPMAHRFQQYIPATAPSDGARSLWTTMDILYKTNVRVAAIIHPTVTVQRSIVIPDMSISSRTPSPSGGR